MESEPSSSARGRRGPGGPKLFSSPAELLDQLSPPGAKLTLNFNDRRWVCHYKHTSDFFIEPYAKKYFTRSFAPSTWKQKLEEVHEFAWNKWQLAQSELPLGAGVEPQMPGKLPRHLLPELEAAVRDMPEPKKY